MTDTGLRKRRAPLWAAGTPRKANLDSKINQDAAASSPVTVPGNPSGQPATRAGTGGVLPGGPKN